MFKENNKKPLCITMTEGDFGITLPIKIDTENDEVITSNDSFVLNIFKGVNTEPLISKIYNNIEDNIVPFELTEQESLLLSVGGYVYDLDWYQNGQFMCNLVSKETYLVEEKAKKVGVVNEG